LRRKCWRGKIKHGARRPLHFSPIWQHHHSHTSATATGLHKMKTNPCKMCLFTSDNLLPFHVPIAAAKGHLVSKTRLTDCTRGSAVNFRRLHREVSSLVIYDIYFWSCFSVLFTSFDIAKLFLRLCNHILNEVRAQRKKHKSDG
jgi:hypothetical protein